MNMSTPRKPKSMATFVIIWLGQLVSLVGSCLTSFALSLWVYEQTGSSAQFALIVVAIIGILASLAISAYQTKNWRGSWVPGRRDSLKPYGRSVTT